MVSTARRSPGEGSLFRRKSDGRWVAQLSVGPRAEQVVRTRYGKTRAEAQAKLRNLVAAQAIAPPVVPEPPMMPRVPIGAASARVPVAIARSYLATASQQGWKVRSAAEARVAYRLALFGIGPGGVVTQHQIGRYRLDFALPDVLVAIEVDGPHHRLPENAARDLERDLSLHDAGWMVFRVDAYADEDRLGARLARIVRFVRAERLG